MIGNVAAGSWFASLTSTAMGGYGLAGLTMAVQSAGVCTSVAGLITITGLLNRDGDEEDGEDTVAVRAPKQSQKGPRMTETERVRKRPLV